MPRTNVAVETVSTAGTKIQRINPDAINMLKVNDAEGVIMVFTCLSTSMTVQIGTRNRFGTPAFRFQDYSLVANETIVIPLSEAMHQLSGVQDPLNGNEVQTTSALITFTGTALTASWPNCAMSAYRLAR